MEFLDTLPDFVRMLLALGFVVALMGGLALILKKMGLAGAEAEAPSSKRLKLLERLPLDARRQLVLLSRDDQQHLVILSAQGETVIETNIKEPK